MENTKVIVRFTETQVFEFQNYKLELECVLLHLPQGEGDHFVFQYNDIKFSVNPLCASFAGVVYL